MIGQYTNWIYEMLHLFAQPTLEATLNDTFDLYDDTIPLVHLDHVGPNIATMVTSHLVVGLILSPLELVRTRYRSAMYPMSLKICISYIAY